MFSAVAIPSPSPVPISGINPVLAFREADRGMPRALAAVAREPATAKAFSAFERALAEADSPRALLDNRNARAFLAKALGVPDLAETPALFVRAMLSDPRDPGSLVSRLPDRRLATAAATLNFATRGLEVVRDPAVMQRLKDGWIRTTHFERLRSRDPALVDALVFKEQAASASGSVYAILGHPVLRRVVMSTLGLPLELAVQSVEAQARAVTQRLDVTRLADPRFVTRFLERFLVRTSAESRGASDSAVVGLPSAIGPPVGLPITV